jgi:hypothetical protein
MKKFDPNIYLDQSVLYEICVPGELNSAWLNWFSGTSISIEQNDEDKPITIITGLFDQAGLHSLLRQLYALGLPILSVICRQEE